MNTQLSLKSFGISSTIPSNTQPDPLIFSHNSVEEELMAAYIISALDIHDKEKYDQVYFPALLKQVEQYGGKLLAASEKQQVMEGNWLRGRTVLWNSRMWRRCKLGINQKNMRHSSKCGWTYRMGPSF